MIWFYIAVACLIIAFFGCILFGTTDEDSAWEDSCLLMIMLGVACAITFGIAGIIAVTVEDNDPGHTKEALTQFSQLYPAAVNPVLAYDNISYKDYTSGTAQLCTITFRWDEAHKVAVWAEPVCGKIVG